MKYEVELFARAMEESLQQESLPDPSIGSVVIGIEDSEGYWRLVPTERFEEQMMEKIKGYFVTVDVGQRDRTRLADVAIAAMKLWWNLDPFGHIERKGE